MPFEPATQVAPGVHLVDTGYVKSHLAACYLLRGRDSVAVVETGNAGTVPRVLAALDAAGLPRASVSHVIVTHVHLDHAGGAGALMAALPQATLVAHPRGARHLVDPAKLWAGTVGVYGAEATQQLYGDPVAIPAARVVEAPDGFTLDLGARPLCFLDAPGHARHHFVVHDEVTRGLFTGDTFGLSYRQLDTARGPFFFPTTTPVQFDPEALHATLDRLMGLAPERLYLTHYGCVTGGLAAHAATLHRGIDAFVRIARAAPAGPGRHAAVKVGLTGLLLSGLADHGAPVGQAEALAWFDNDLELNAQGLEVWLDGATKA
ncbi:MAG: MBL fold metallo-hydrolase [Anaeromyxobacter sp.]|nr:MBL fold metallo-hydrolase [Anaeromyxobacter sp.]MBL0277294.1 MBL fold metallo-hydrolase [Anaeromyxobacter sp.]